MPRRKTYQEVLEAFSTKGYKLISKEYVNNKQKLEYICPLHPDKLQKIRLNDLLSNHGCYYCALKDKAKNLGSYADTKLKESDIVDFLKQSDFITIGIEYKGVRSIITVSCPEHPTEIQKVRFTDIRERKYACKHCLLTNSRLPLEEVKSLFRSKGYLLVDTNYINSSQNLRFICEKHPDKFTETSVSSLKGGHGCYYCGIEKIKGKLSPHYNHDISEEARVTDRRYDPKEREWRMKVFTRDNFTCQVCGDTTGGNLNAHHLDGYHWCVEKRYEVDNGITLCRGCHKSFHSKYLSKDNTREQFEEWLQISRG